MTEPKVTDGRERLTEILRDGDPAAGGPPLATEEREAMRRRIVDRALRRERTPAADRGSARARLRLAAVAASLVVLLALTLTLGLPRRTPPPAPPETAAAAQTQERAPREIQFTTEAGTLIVWVLNPEPDLGS